MGHLWVSMFHFLASAGSKWQFANTNKHEQLPSTCLNWTCFDMQINIHLKHSWTSLPCMKGILKMNSFRTVTISFSSFTKWGPNTIKTKVREKLEQPLGAFITTLTTKKQPVEFSLRSELYWTVYKIKKRLVDIYNRLPQVFNSHNFHSHKNIQWPLESCMKATVFLMYLHSFNLFFSYHLSVYLCKNQKQNNLVYHSHLVLSIAHIWTNTNNYLAVRQKGHSRSFV